MLVLGVKYDIDINYVFPLLSRRGIEVIQSLYFGLNQSSFNQLEIRLGLYISSRSFVCILLQLSYAWKLLHPGLIKHSHPLHCFYFSTRATPMKATVIYCICTLSFMISVYFILLLHEMPWTLENPGASARTFICLTFTFAGYCFLLFQDEMSVQALINSCVKDDGKLYWSVSSPTVKDKPVS